MAYRLLILHWGTWHHEKTLEANVAWTVADFDFGGTDTVFVQLSDGQRTLEILADIELGPRHAVLRGLHIQGAGPNTVGPRELLRLIRWAKEWLDVDELRIEGASRTSGAGPGRLPPPIDT